MKMQKHYLKNLLMNQYTQKVNIPIDLSHIDFASYKEHGKKQIRCDKSIFGDNGHQWFASVGLEIQWLEIFCLKPFEKHIIHCDGHEIDNKAKLNYITGGDSSVMIWYTAPEDKIIKGMSKANTRYLMAEEKDAQELYREELTGFNIVNVGVLHTVRNRSKDRFCISMAIADNETGVRLDYTDLCKRLS